LHDDPGFFPMNLVWSHRGTITLPVLLAEVPQHCDFCAFLDLKRVSPPLVHFCTEVEPNQVADGSWPTKKPPGRYRAEIVVTADDAKPLTKELEIVFTGVWSDDAVQVATHELQVAVV
jgi:hypothetical protein